MGSSCSSGSKKDKCSKKNKSDNNGANHSHRGSNASNSSVYVYQKASAQAEAGEPPPPPASAPSGAGLLPAAAGAEGPETPFPTPAAKPKVERTDSHSAVSVSSPMSPTQLLRQTSKDGDQEAGMGRIDLQSVPEHVRLLLSGHVTEGQHWLDDPSPRALRIILCRYGQAGSQEQQQIQQEHEALENNVFETLRTHCAERGYELETLILDESADQEDWGWAIGGQQPLTIFLLFVSECAPVASYPLPTYLPPHPEAVDSLDAYYERDDNAVDPSKKYLLRSGVTADDRIREKLRAIYPRETRTGWEWIADRLVRESRLCRRTVCVWKRLLQSPHATTALQQRLLESVDETRFIKCNVKWQEALAGAMDEQAHRCYVEDLCAQLHPILTALMESLLDENETSHPTAFGIPSFIGASRRLYSELVEHHRVARELLRASEEQETSTVAAIRDYLQSDVPWPLVVHGGVGSGKSRAVAAAVHLCHSKWLPSAHVVFRFAHQTPESQSVDRLLISVIEQCCLLLGEPRPSQAVDLPGLLQRLAPARPLIVLLDGLDCLVPSTSSPSSNLQWLPTILPDNVRLVLTVTSPSPVYDHLCSVLALDESTEAGFVAVPPLSECSASGLLQSQLLAKGRQLTQEQKHACEVAAKNLPNPMYLSLVTHCALRFASSHSAEALPLRDSLESQAEVLLASLEEELDPSLLSSAFAYILLSKHGLSAAELSNLTLRSLSLKRGSHEESLWNQKLALFIHRLGGRLSPAYLRTVVVGDRTLFRIPCPAFRAVLQRRYLGDQERTEAARASLKAFWEAAEMQFGSRLNRRKLDELPRMSGVPLDRFVFDWNWVFSKVCGSPVNELMEDIAEADVPPEARPEVDILVDFLRASMATLTYDGRQFFSQLHARLSLPSSAKESSFPHLSQLLKSCSQRLPASSLLCPTAAGYLRPTNLPSPPASPEIPQKIAFTSLHRIKDNPYFAVSLSPSQNEVVVWDIYEQREERRFRGIVQPRDIKFIDEHRAVILCNRELCIYDLNEGSFLVKLKGVMNQKMAYYDLHNSDHVVSLSRNRMYVNMMNLSTGDCVATFKVGEDRFLNSLLVSANGRICVCGDETQKPFPLLVWDLTNRKLLYDLRIPHHDFVTSLSAITSDGHYAVCVCQEVSDPTPNFIIVYDLQNGTLFKKWKPDVSTCSVAISSEGGCVITGLVDTSILVWDLATGACRHTLQGHTAPVSLIKLDNNGHRCLTADLPKQRDPAIRLWDLSKGICLASFMGDSPIMCCELTSNGEAVILGLADNPTILTLILVEEGHSLPDALPSPARYGNAEYQGKQVDFSEKGS